jgi:hypothetical protein
MPARTGLPLPPGEGWGEGPWNGTVLSAVHRPLTLPSPGGLTLAHILEACP